MLRQPLVFIYWLPKHPVFLINLPFLTQSVMLPLFTNP